MTPSDFTPLATNLRSNRSFRGRSAMVVKWSLMLLEIRIFLMGPTFSVKRIKKHNLTQALASLFFVIPIAGP